ncbi:MAG: hypothetical protein U9M90_04865 [Patescibacteria group bacterium]|nr:hypothetical protein [Patescibacteria group bacterium]
MFALCFGGFAVISLGIMVFLAVRESCVCCCKKSDIEKYCFCDIEIECENSTIFSGRLLRRFERAKRQAYAN